MIDLARNVQHFVVYVRQFSKKIIVSQRARCRIPSLIILHQELKTTHSRRKVWITFYKVKRGNEKVKIENKSFSFLL